MKKSDHDFCEEFYNDETGAELDSGPLNSMAFLENPYVRWLESTLVEELRHDDYLEDTIVDDPEYELDPVDIDNEI